MCPFPVIVIIPLSFWVSLRELELLLPADLLSILDFYSLKYISIGDTKPFDPKSEGSKSLFPSNFDNFFGYFWPSLSFWCLDLPIFYLIWCIATSSVFKLPFSPETGFVSKLRGGFLVRVFDLGISRLLRIYWDLLGKVTRPVFPEFVVIKFERGLIMPVWLYPSTLEYTSLVYWIASSEFRFVLGLKVSPRCFNSAA